MAPLDRMDPDAYPWPQRFKFNSYNLRRTYYSYMSPAAAVNFATHSLFNASTGNRVLLVRGFSVGGASSTGPTGFFSQPGPLGSHTGTETPLWAGERAGAGQHFYIDAAALTNPQFAMFANINSNFFNINSMPLAVLPPAWSFIVQGGTSALTMRVCFFWEELAINDPMLGAIGQAG